MTDQIVIALSREQSEFVRGLLYAYLKNEKDEKQLEFANTLVDQFEQCESDDRNTEEENEEDEDEDGQFINFYECQECGHEWEDAWSCQCDDDCPECGTRHISPYKSEDA